MVRACVLLGVPRSSVYHHLAGGRASTLTIPHVERNYPNRLSPEEQQAIVERLNQDDVADLSIRQAHYELLDHGEYLGSLATMHRVMRTAGQSADRRRSNGDGRALPRTKPVLLADAPRQVWCWDITDLRGPGRQRFKLFSMLDLYSRCVVGHCVETYESKELATAFIQNTINAEAAQPVVIHADNGSSMRAGTVQDLLASLHITASYSRPRVSNDNAYVESLFKTVKYDRRYPERFDSLEHARDWAEEFFTDYNTNHHHHGLAGHTPERVHDGSWPTHHERWRTAKDNYALDHPHRHPNPPVTHEPPDTVWINPPNHQLSQTA